MKRSALQKKKNEVFIKSLTGKLMLVAFVEEDSVYWQDSEIALNSGSDRQQFHTLGLRMETQSLNDRFFSWLLCAQVAFKISP